MQSLSSRQPLLRMTLEGWKWTRIWKKSFVMKQESGSLNMVQNFSVSNLKNSTHWSQEEETSSQLGDEDTLLFIVNKQLV